jgi:pilus biogenesis lipoprotein CpaD
MTNQAPFTTSLLAAISMLGLGACVHTDVETATPAETVMRNSVQMVRLTHEIGAEEDGTATPSGGTLARMNAFLTGVEAGYSDVIMLDSADAPADRIDAIADHLRARGLSFGGTATLGAAPASGTIMLYLERYIVTVPNCGQWREETSDNSRNNPSSFLGCSLTANLGLMVANPRDLLAGQGSGNSTAAAVGALYTPPAATPAAGNMVLSLDGMTMSAPMPQGNRQ